MAAVSLLYGGPPLASPIRVIASAGKLHQIPNSRNEGTRRFETQLWQTNIFSGHGERNLAKRKPSRPVPGENAEAVSLVRSSSLKCVGASYEGSLERCRGCLGSPVLCAVFYHREARRTDCFPRWKWRRLLPNEFFGYGSVWLSSFRSSVGSCRPLAAKTLSRLAVKSVRSRPGPTVFLNTMHPGG